MKSKYTVAGMLLAVFGAAALLVFSGGIFFLVLVVGGVAATAFGLYEEAKVKEGMREAAMRHIQEASGSPDSPLLRVRRELSKLRFEAHIEKDAARALAQLDLADERYRRFEQALRARLNPGEVTYDRYLGAGRQVYEVIVSGLGEVAGLLPEVQSARAGGGERYLPRRPAGPALPSGQAPADTSGSQERRLDEVLRGNERALKEMDAAVAAVAKWQGGPEMSRELGKKLDESLAELRDLSRQAGKYR